jgi:hypothetical protein
MVLVIMPLVKEAHRGRPKLRMMAYAISLVATATISGALVSAAGYLLHGHARTILLAVAGISILYAFREARVIRLPLPSRSWQVPPSWAQLGYYRSGVMYGVALGVGWLTRTPFATYHVTVLWQLASGIVVYGAMLGFAYGVARSCGMWLASSIAARRTSGTPVMVGQWIFGQSALIRIINAAALSLAGGCLLAQ